MNDSSSDQNVDQESEDEAPKVPSIKEALHASETLLQWARFQENSNEMS